MADTRELRMSGVQFRVLSSIDPVTWNIFSFETAATDLKFNPIENVQDDAQSRLGEIIGITSNTSTVKTGVCASSKLVNITSGEVANFTLPRAAWSSSTIAISGNNYHTQSIEVKEILLNHPVMYLAIDTIPTDDERDAWGGLEMVTEIDGTTCKLNFYIEDIPNIDLKIGVKGVVKLDE